MITIVNRDKCYINDSVIVAPGSGVCSDMLQYLQYIHKIQIEPIQFAYKIEPFFAPARIIYGPWVYYTQSVQKCNRLSKMPTCARNLTSPKTPPRMLPHNGTSSIICMAPSLPNVIMTSPKVFVAKPASQYVK